MPAFILSRILQAIPVLFVVGFIAYAMFSFVGDPVKAMLGIEATDAQRIDLQHNLGLDQPFLETKAFAEALRVLGQGGAVLFIGAPEQALGSDHAAAVGALGNLVKTLGVEWARDGIRVNAILSNAEGPTRGNLAAYLVSDYAAYVTGAVMGIDCDGG